MPNPLFTLQACDSDANDTINNVVNDKFRPLDVPDEPGDDLDADTASEDSQDDDQSQVFPFAFPQFNYLEFRLNQIPKNPARGFTFGRRGADVTLGSHKNGISRECFRVHPVGGEKLTLTIKAKLGIQFSWQFENFGTEFKEMSVALKPLATAWLNVKYLLLNSETRKYSPVWKRFQLSVGSHSQDELRDLHWDTLPVLPTGLSSLSSTVHASALQTPRSDITLIIDDEKDHYNIFSKISVAKDSETGIKYACKVFVGQESIHYNDIMREIDILKSLCHPYIVKYFDSEITQVPFKLFMEYHEAGSLARQIQQQPLSKYEYHQVGLQTLDALRYMHSCGVVHGAISPANILVHVRNTSEIHIKITDFGQTLPKEMMPSDMWCFGVMLLRIAYNVRNDHILCNQLLDTAVEQIPSDPLIDFIRENLLLPDPAHRTSAELCYDMFPRPDILMPTLQPPSRSQDLPRVVHKYTYRDRGPGYKVLEVMNGDGMIRLRPSHRAVCLNTLTQRWTSIAATIVGTRTGETYMHDQWRTGMFVDLHKVHLILDASNDPNLQDVLSDLKHQSGVSANLDDSTSDEQPYNVLRRGVDSISLTWKDRRQKFTININTTEFLVDLDDILDLQSQPRAHGKKKLAQWSKQFKAKLYAFNGRSWCSVSSYLRICAGYNYESARFVLSHFFESQRAVYSTRVKTLLGSADST